MTATWDPWNYREIASLGTETTNLVGYKVHATDGDIGKVDEAKGRLTDQPTLDIIRQQLAAFAQFITRVGPKG